MLEPFKIAIPETVLEDLSTRLRAARFPSDTSDDWEAGTSSTYLKELVRYWRDQFDWRAQEVHLNKSSHFLCQVDGTRLHLIHEKGDGPATGKSSTVAVNGVGAKASIALLPLGPAIVTKDEIPFFASTS